MKMFFLKLWIIILGDKSCSRIIGLLLLLPSIISVLFVLINVFGFGFYSFGDLWDDYTSSFPFYLGFMGAIGAYLIKGTDK